MRDYNLHNVTHIIVSGVQLPVKMALGQSRVVVVAPVSLKWPKELARHVKFMHARIGHDGNAVLATVPVQGLPLIRSQSHG